MTMPAQEEQPAADVNLVIHHLITDDLANAVRQKAILTVAWRTAQARVQVLTQENAILNAQVQALQEQLTLAAAPDAVIEPEVTHDG